MKDSEFIELLNLYLDHEISPADAARLEAEVQANPARRRTYETYCRMQKACKVLAKDFVPEPEASPEHNVIAFETASVARKRRRVFAVSSFAAAAACVAIVFVGVSRHSTSITQPADGIAKVAPAVVAPSAVAAPATTEPAQVVAASREVVTPTEPRQLPGSLARAGNPQNVLTTVVDIDPQLSWLQDVRIAPIQLPTTTVEQLRLNQDPQDRTYTGNKPLPADVRATAIRFQR